MNLGQWVFVLLGAAAGLLFIGAALHGLRSGRMASPQRIVHGNPVGRVYIERGLRPFAFWFVVTAYVLFGVTILASLWLVIP